MEAQAELYIQKASIYFTSMAIFQLMTLHGIKSLSDLSIIINTVHPLMRSLLIHNVIKLVVLTVFQYS